MWISSSLTGSSLETYLNNQGAKVDVSKHTSSSIAYSANGVTLHQKETETVSEFRGLTQATAENLEACSSDNTVSTTYRKTVDGEVLSATVVTGTKTSYVASRANEADGWKVTKTETVYAPDTDPDDADDWSDSSSSTSLSDIGQTVQVSEDKTSSYQFGTGSTAIYSIVTTKVYEIRLLTATGKTSQMNSATNNGAQVREHQYCCNTGASTYPYMVSAWCSFNHGTDVTVSARYVSEEEGWTVTKTMKIYDFYPTGGRAPSNNGASGKVGWYLV